MLIDFFHGMLQYYNLGVKHPDLIEKRRRAFAANLSKNLQHTVKPGAH